MADVVTPEVRSRMMAGIRGKNTKPEMLIRRGLHRLGLRFLVHDKRLPGKPDMVFPKWQAAIFVNGCFWHGHDCRLFKLPSTRTEFWRDKICANKERDRMVIKRLEDTGWRTLTIWECQIKGRSTEEIESVLVNCRNWLTDEPVSAHQ
ncbi:very short patch repair endonuclease [Sphingopyxis sp. MC1]|uniref:very short patch repair endonuclease n=1 Tax=Sphingopyxis sp. MC1 TaxID=1174684 RepID=UPI0002D17D07|nr:very short patch repair endonuclease [Sphingopyxis sp. MC1]ENY80350.1 DNA mismatch endonuclease Vsr [Sphingopyxis sp. MC1]